MKIYIDADGCPVVRNTLKIAGGFNIPCVIICDTAHRIEHENVETIVVDKGVDSVDFRLVNLIQQGDIAITQDYGLAAMCLSKRAVVLNQDGKEYTNENISGLLEFRAASKKIRNSGGRLKGMPKRTGEQDRAFEFALQNLLNKFKKSDII
ncbi:MAG: YaiI/YqxD family protein [Ruminococcus flavefaciens]|nr:YaiI/YqxD family protein [Ruminococcus flavefaciens]